MDSQWLKSQFHLNPGKTKADLAKALGLEPPAVSKILAGTRQIKATEYLAMRKFFGMPGDGSHALNKRISPNSQENEQALLLNDNPQNSGDWILPASLLKLRNGSSPRGIRILAVSETTMEPEFRLGDPVVVDTTDTNPSPPGIFMLSDGFGSLIRHCAIKTGSKPPMIQISAHQKNFEMQTIEMEAVTILGRVIAKLQWV